MRFGFSKPRIDQLDRYLANKDYDKALEAVAAELRGNPSQFNLLLRQAEILGLAGDRERAVTVYRELAEKYARDGFYAKAIALYKKVVRLKPELEDVHSELARLIEEDRRSRLPLAERIAVRPRPEAARGAQPAPKPVPEAGPRPTPVTPPSGGDEEILDADALLGSFEGAVDLAADESKELEASTLFSSFPDAALERLLSSTSLRSYDEGDIIVTEGEQGSSLFLIVSGRVKVFTLGSRGEHIPLAELGPGDFFGEVSLLTGRPRTATITAASSVTAIELVKDDFDAIVIDHPEVREVVETFYERRAEATVEAVIRRMREG